MASPAVKELVLFLACNRNLCREWKRPASLHFYACFSVKTAHYMDDLERWRDTLEHCSRKLANLLARYQWPAALGHAH